MADPYHPEYDDAGRPPVQKRRAEPKVSRRVFDQQFTGPVLGMDEVGLGCIAGPVYAAGVVLPDDQQILDTLMGMGLNDSKKMKTGARQRVYQFLEENFVFAVTAVASVEELETRGIYNALDGLYRSLYSTFTKTVCPKTVLIDGGERPRLRFPHRTVVKGDSKSLAIAAASVVAKVERDRYMVALGGKFPGYRWESNKGYPTGEHLLGLDELGPNEHHRMWTRPLKKLSASQERRLEAISGR